MNTSSFEVEVKIPIQDVEEVERKIREVGGVKTNSETQIDTYFNHPCRNFESTDEALRIRKRERISVSNSSSAVPDTKVEVTFKGPKIDDTTKTRVEVSAAVNDAVSMSSILSYLGFREVATIVKERIFFTLGDMVVSIDSVKKVGTFLEVEQIVESEDMVPETKDMIFTFLDSIGLEREDSIRESYLELYLERTSSS